MHNYALKLEEFLRFTKGVAHFYLFLNNLKTIINVAAWYHQIIIIKSKSRNT